MSISELRAIDVHAHYGVYRRGESDLIDEWMSGDAETVIARAKQAHIEYSVVSPIASMMPRGIVDPCPGNADAAKTVDATDGLLQWVVVNPLHPASFPQAEEMLVRPKCVGLKFHPEEHVYPIAEHGTKLFEFAAKHRAVVLAHSGEDNSLPMDYVPFANAFPEVRLILGHLGHRPDEDPSHQVRAIEASRHGNVYVDTSSSNSIIAGLVEWAVGRVGAERVLFGTDTPLYMAPMQRARIDYADIGDADKRRILRDNAVELLGLGV